MARDPYTDDEYDDTYKEVHGDEPAKDQYTNQATDDTFFPSGVGSTLSPSGWGLWPSNTAADAEYGDNEARGGPEARDTSETEDEGWLTEGVISMVLVIGVALFLFPEPVTSAVGIGLIAVGVVAWVVDWLS